MMEMKKNQQHQRARNAGPRLPAPVIPGGRWQPKRRWDGSVSEPQFKFSFEALDTAPRQKWLSQLDLCYVWLTVSPVIRI